MIKKTILTTVFLLSVFLFFGTKAVSAQAVTLSLFPANIVQGDPFLVQINGITEISLIKKITFDGKERGIFMYKGKPSALAGINLSKKPGTYELKVEFGSGNIIKENISVGLRKKVKFILGIPKKLGGNTTKSQNTLVATLVDEKKSLTDIPTGNQAFWSDKFIPPLKQIFVTDGYGNSRITGTYSIPHIGVDYKAKVGTEVMAVNRGVVRINGFYRNYGKTIVIDHGLGLMTFYLHLSKTNVKVGDNVERGQVIGLSGDSGYTQGPHLHFGVNINEVAIDPEKFLALFK
jgi:murein DD-endopeptidase MepM/ murein hydrolase activator NlpD